MISGKKTLSLLLVAMLAVVAVTVVASDGSSAVSGIGTGEAGDFIEDREGTISVPIKADNEATVVFQVYVDGESTPSKTVTEDVPGGTSTVKIGITLGDGNHTVRIVASSDDITLDPSEFTVTIHVDRSIWSNITTYLALIAIVIVIVIAAFYYMRSKPKKVGGTTFTELEEQKKAEKSAVSEAPAKTGTERRRYSKPSESEAPAVKAEPAPEKKPKSFTEMEDAKKAKKKEPAKQEPPKAEPAKKKEEPAKADSSKKIKYVSSRRK